MKNRIIEVLMVITLLCIMLVWYALFCSMTLDFNPFKWDDEVFFCFSVGELVVIGIGYFLMKDQSVIVE